MVPIIAGNTKLINHIKKVANKIPIVFEDTNPNRNTATEPLTPSSVIAIVGITEITNNIIIIKIIASE